MKLQLAKWGNSLAVRLPVECTRAAGLREGDTVEAEVTQVGEIRLMPTHALDIQGRTTNISALAFPGCRGSMYPHVSTWGRQMKLQLAKWGNSLAVRLPVECTRAAGLREGDTVEAEVTQVGEIRLMPTHAFDKAAFLNRLGKLHARMPMTTTTVEAIRQEDRY